MNPVLVKAWDQKKQLLRWERVSPAEKKKYDYLNSELDYISEQLAILFKSKRPSGKTLDFHSLAIWDTDFQGADVSGADITAANLSNLNLKGANLGGITRFDAVVFWGSAWWESAAISHELLAYLEVHYPFDPDITYASGRRYTQAQYETELGRLRAPVN